MQEMSAGLTKLLESKVITKEWLEAAPEAFQYFYDKIGPQLKDTSYYPDFIDIFRAFNECSPDNVKVVILGQDPYFDGSATGLAFDNLRESKKVSPSLRKILKEIQNCPVEDTAYFTSNEDKTDSYLGHLPSQGVLLWNTALTVEPSKPGSHIDLWAPFTDKIVEYLNSKDNIIWILWGNYARAYKDKITNTSHYFIEGTHPAARPNVKIPFEGGKYFSQCNSHLRTLNKVPIAW